MVMWPSVLADSECRLGGPCGAQARRCQFLQVSCSQRTSRPRGPSSEVPVGRRDEFALLSCLP